MPDGIIVGFERAARSLAGEVASDQAGAAAAEAPADPCPKENGLGQLVKGYFNDHAVPTNSQALAAFRLLVTKLWQRSLRRRSQKDGTIWERITELANEWIPKPFILQPWASVRFAAKHPRREPYAGKPLVRFHAGGAQKSASLARS